VSREQKEAAMLDRGMKPSSGALPVHVPKRDEDEGAGGRSAMDIMRDLKKRK
jgi:hypothetical protein